MSRVFDHRRLWRLDERGFAAAAELLAAAVAARHVPDLVVGVARGGVPLATALASRLGVAWTAVAARHNPTDAAYAPASGRVTVDGEDVRLAPLAPGIRVLVADDICGSGATLAAVTRRLADSIRPMAFTTCTLCRNEGSGRTPDLWVWDVRDWVAFPWEPTPAGETVPLPAPTSVQRARS